MSIRRRLALMICPELTPARTIDLGALRARDEARRAAHPCLMQDHGPGHHTAYCSRCRIYVSVALPNGCSVRPVRRF